MSTIHAMDEYGVFRPTTPVELPEGSEVTIEPIGDAAPRPSDPAFAHPDPRGERGRRESSIIARRRRRPIPPGPDLATRSDRVPARPGGRDSARTAIPPGPVPDGRS